MTEVKSVFSFNLHECTAVPPDVSHLIDGKYSIEDLIDLEKLRKIMENFYLTTGLAIGFTAYPSQINLIATGWQDICTKFHRFNLASDQCCLRSNMALTEKCKFAGDMSIELCGNGLVDGGVPIIIRGKHLATLIAGQVFFQPPDLEYFKKQALIYGYNVDAYLEAVKKVTVVNQEQFKAALSFLGEIAILIAELGYNNLEIKEKNLKLQQEIVERKTAEYKLQKLYNEVVNSQKKLKKLALIDSQTNLFNHRYLEEAIEVEFFRAQRTSNPLSVLMLDVDYFKSINDAYGHQFGDLVLRQLALKLKVLVRRYDTVVRFGGEEFVIILPDVDRQKALILARRILDAVSLHNFGKEDNIVKLKMSIGVANYPEDNIKRGINLIDIADEILNKAKEEGGNRVHTSLDAGKKHKISVLAEDAKFPLVKSLKDKIEKLSRRSKQSLIESIFAFARTIELRDHYTGSHVEMTVEYATSIAKKMSLSEDEVNNIRQASVLHDLGKIAISDKILHKSTKLTKYEYDIIKKHPYIGADIIRPIHFMHNIIPLILYHHERWDGKGYPVGLKAEEIPIGARIVAVADVYQALTSNRPYRKALPKEKAIDLIKQGAGSQFDPRITDIFINILREGRDSYRLK